MIAKFHAFLIALGVLVLLAASVQAEGTLEIRIKDHREAIGDFAKLMLTLDKIAISPKAGLKFWQSGWKNLDPLVSVIDLTRYVDQQSAQVFRGTLADGTFDGLQVKLKQVAGTLKKKQRAAKIKNSVGPIKLPFKIAPKDETLIILDLVVLDMSDHPSQGYDLGIKGWELYTNGKLVDKIPPG